MIFWKRKSSLVQPRQVSKKQLELETAKQILQEVFHASPLDVDDMIHGRLEEKNYPVKCEEGLWPATFCLED
ncbi:MAG: hypothetical protein PHU23_01255 [Dehalococcoidales bacterium]|nr:hypothetical protein [Dehalococcoidales bacterium]